MAKCYEKYKDSGIAWIGEIPEHWSVKRLNDIGKYRKGPFGSALKVDSFILFVDTSLLLFLFRYPLLQPISRVTLYHYPKVNAIQFCSGIVKEKQTVPI